MERRGGYFLRIDSELLSAAEKLKTPKRPATLATAHFSPLAALPSAVFSPRTSAATAWLARRPLRDAWHGPRSAGTSLEHVDP